MLQITTGVVVYEENTGIPSETNTKNSAEEQLNTRIKKQVVYREL